MVRAKPFLVVAPMVIGVLGSMASARAEGEESGATRALSLSEEGRMDMSNGHYAEACPKFADSNALDPGAGTMLNLAFCYEKLGKRAQAWAEYQSAAAAAHLSGKPEWESAAHTRASQLEAAVAWMVVHLDKADDAEQLDIRVDGEPFAVRQLERPTPVDPGRHDVKVTAAGKQSWSTTFEVDAHDSPTVVVPALEPLPLAAPSPVTPGPETRPAWVTRGDAGPDRTWGAQRMAAVAVAGAGVGALGVASGFTVAGFSTYHGADCAAGKCTRQGSDAQSRARNQADVTTVLASAGGIALATAAVLWWTSGSHSQGVRVEPTAWQTSWGLSVRVEW